MIYLCIILIIALVFVSYEYYVVCSSQKYNNTKQEDAFQKSIKNIYDEHIFSITHELRSPLAVIASSINNQYNILKQFYNTLPSVAKEQYKPVIKDMKQQIEYIKNQSETIESFIKSISEHASYISDTNDKKYIDLHKYLVSILINSNSFSRNMRIFQNNITFGDIAGADFMHTSIQVNPHDLSRMLTNIMTNAADAVASSYKQKKLENPDYTPFLKIRCIKSDIVYKNPILSADFLRINTDVDEQPQPLYLIIEDNGPGISKENITKIFRYGGFSTKNKEEDNHYGLGLQLSLKLASKNNIKMYIRTNYNGTMIVLGFPKIHYEKPDSDINIIDSKNISTDTSVMYKECCVGSKTDQYSILKK